VKLLQIGSEMTENGDKHPIAGLNANESMGSLKE
jgi:hypothetical protein